MGREIRAVVASLTFLTGCGLTLNAAPPREDAAIGPGIDAGARRDGGGVDAGEGLADAAVDAFEEGPLDAAGDARPRFDAALDAPRVDAPLAADAFVPDPCAGLASGDECASDPRRVCVGGLCVPSICGDGVLDSHDGEECDPVDPSTDPGCIDCRYECVNDTDCETGTPCVIGGCDAHRCTFTPAPAGTACPSAGEPFATCGGGFCTPPSCGNGMPEGDEECDVGSMPSPGCVGCRFACRTNAECADGNACNGEEYCAPGEGGRVCNDPLTAVVCEPGPCESGLCVTNSTGSAECQYSLLATLDVDADGYPNRLGCGLAVDCNDRDPAVNPGALEICAASGLDVDDDCNAATIGGTLRRWCPDEDADGFGSADLARSMMSCAPPIGVAFGYTLDCSDCFDAGGASAAVAALVHPGQRSFYATQYCSAAGGPCSYDYDCDGALTLQYDEVETCRFLLGCANRDGWQDRVPGCGERHTWITCRGLGACVEADETRAQGCR